MPGSFISTPQYKEFDFIKFMGSSSGYIGFQAPAAASSVILTLPAGDGYNGQALITNGSGVLSWGDVVSSATYTVVSVSSSPYNATQTDGDIVLLVDTTSGDITVNLPTAVDNKAKFTVKKIAGANNITVDANSTETIDGFLTYPITTLNQSETFVNNNANWFAT